MKRLCCTIAVLGLVVGLSKTAAAQPDKHSVGLGVAVGAAFPEGGEDGEDIQVDNWDGSFNWGFYVNIPLIYTFALTPSAELYKFNDQNATDIALAFKFIIPLPFMDIYLGFVPGLTTVGDFTGAHVGGVAGVAFNLIANLDIFVQGKYKVLFEGDKNVRVLHANAGVLFHF